MCVGNVLRSAALLIVAVHKCFLIVLIYDVIIIIKY